MGCGASVPVGVTDTGIGGGAGGGYLRPELDGELAVDLSRAEAAAAAEAGIDKDSFVGSVLAARASCPEDAATIEKCCDGLKAHNAKLKALIATADAEAVHEAMNGGFLGLGCNHRKLIAVLCSRTKAQLEHTRLRYRALYDRDLCADVAGETAGFYGKMIGHVLLSRAEYVADVISAACSAGIWELGCNEMMLIDAFVLCDQPMIREGKRQWEGAHDASLVDFLKKEVHVLPHP